MIHRLRRLRSIPQLRSLVQEVKISITDLVYPVFLVPGKGIKQPITSFTGVFRFSLDLLIKEVEEVVSLGIPAILIFGLPEHKDPLGSEAYNPKGVVQQAIREIKKYFPSLVIITDICLCGYTNSGHCGVVADGKILNDPTLELLSKIAISHAAAGVDLVAPSDMMDGRVRAIRTALDEGGFTETGILSYSAKFASHFYGPFREAAQSAPQFGDRRSYQLPPPNWEEALREVALDIEEGADIVMVKPALPYLDIIQRVKQMFHWPLCAFNVSGEYVMIQSLIEKGLAEEQGIILEVLTSIKRAGADFIITYDAKKVAKWIKENPPLF